MVSKLIEKIQKTKAPICVGLDPMLSYIPEHVTKKAFAEFGECIHGRAARFLRTDFKQHGRRV